MPAIAVGAAIYGGATLATVGVAAMSTMAVIGAVGAIATGVGVVTGNKDLVKIGAIAGLAGGIGAFAESQGWLAAEEMAKPAMEGATEAAVAGATPPPTEAISPDPTVSGYQAPTTDESQVMNGTWDQSQAPTNVIQPQTTQPAGLVNSNTNNINGMDLTPTQSAAVQDAAKKAPETSKSIFGVIGEVGKFMEENKMASALGLNFVGGMFDKKKEAEATAANASAELFRARTSGELLNQEQQRQQMANANAIPDLTGIKIKSTPIYNNTTPPVYNAPRVGLMNSTGR